MKIPPQARSREDFPASRIDADGIEVIRADESRRSVEVVLGVEYASKSGRALSLDLLLPRDSEGAAPARHPLVLFIQGSAWREQVLEQELAQLVRYAASGLVVALVQYRPSSVAPFPAQVRDARTALRFLASNADRFHADAGRLVVWGDSSGGHTATMLALTAGDPFFADEEDGCDPAIRGVVDYYGPTDVGTMNDEPSIQDHDAPDSPEGEFLGCVRVSERQDLVRRASPLDYVSRDRPIPPFLILHGDKDRLVPFGQSVALYRALRDAGHKVGMYRVAGADHGGEAFWTADESYAITRAFIDSCVG